MSRLTNLRDFQQDLTRRIQGAASGETAQQTRLGVQAGARFWLIHLEEAAEVLAVGEITRVPLTRPWFRGLANIRGNLLSVVDFGQFLGGEATPASLEARLVMVNERFHVSAALLVTRMLGLRSIPQLEPLSGAGDAPWIERQFRDADGRVWNELSMGELVYHPDFMQVGL